MKFIVLIVFSAMCLVSDPSNAGFLGDFKKTVKSAGNVLKKIPKVVVPLQPAIDIVRGKKSPDQAVRGLVNDTGQLLQSGTEVLRTTDLAVSQTFQKAAALIPGDAGRIVYEIVEGPNRYLRELAFTATGAAAAVLQGQDPLIAVTLPVAAAIRDSRNQFYPQSKPLSEDVKSVLAPIIPAQILSRARIATGRVSISLPTAISAIGSLFNRERDAVTLDDVIVFINEPDFDSFSGMMLLVHELYHVYQYESWGVELFAYRYVKNYGRVEGEAEQAEEHGKQYVGQIRGGNVRVVSGGAFTKPVASVSKTVRTPLGTTNIFVPASRSERLNSFGNIPLTDRCMINGEFLVVNGANVVMSVNQSGMAIGRRVNPLNLDCIFDLTNQFNGARFCVQRGSGLVYAGAPIPVGRCQQCNNRQCIN